MMWLIVITMIALYGILILWTKANSNRLEKKAIVVYIVVGIMLTLFLSVILVLCNKIQVEDTSASHIITIANILLFAPINALIVLPTIGKTINRYKAEEITIKQVKMQLVIKICIFIAIIIFEIGYIQSNNQSLFIMYQNRAIH